MSRYRPLSVLAIEPGMRIRLTNKHRAADATTIVEGVVERLAGSYDNSGEKTPTEVIIAGLPFNLLSFSEPWAQTALDLVLPDLPTAVGSAIKIYDVNLLRDRLAVLRVNDQDQKVWEVVESGFWATASELERAEVVFDGDPNKNG